MVSCSLVAASERAARLTATVVQPTPPAAPVTVMIRGPCVAGRLRLILAANQPRDHIEDLGRLGRQRKKLARSGTDGLQDQAAVGRSGSRAMTTAPGWLESSF